MPKTMKPPTRCFSFDLSDSNQNPNGVTIKWSWLFWCERFGHLVESSGMCQYVTLKAIPLTPLSWAVTYPFRRSNTRANVFNVLWTEKMTAPIALSPVLTREKWQRLWCRQCHTCHTQWSWIGVTPNGIQVSKSIIHTGNDGWTLLCRGPHCTSVAGSWAWQLPLSKMKQQQEREERTTQRTNKS